jgi:hypothetical protein
MTRVNHKKVKCHQCGREVTAGASLEEYHCICGYIGEIKIKTSNLRAASDTSKHIVKLLDKITGTHKPTKVVNNITQFLVTWITDVKYIREWLYSDDKLLSSWIDRYKKLMPDVDIVPAKFFSQPRRERTPEYQMKYTEFKLYTDEFYNMLEHHKKIAANSKNNVVNASEDTILEIIENYVDEYGDEIPASSFVYEYEGQHYDLGAYFNFLSLIHDPNDYPLKKVIEDYMNVEIRQPGLMSTFTNLRSETVTRFPMKFHYGQEYVYFMHEIFHTPYPVITPVDKHHLVKLIMNFNSFYKHNNKTRKGKECNAPLFACVLQNILGLPYFEKYRESIIRLLPEKTTQTESLIASQWLSYKMKNYKELIMYHSSSSELPELSATSSAAVTEDEADNEEDEFEFDFDMDGDDDVL